MTEGERSFSRSVDVIGITVRTERLCTLDIKPCAEMEVHSETVLIVAYCQRLFCCNTCTCTEF